MDIDLQRLRAAIERANAAENELDAARQHFDDVIALHRSAGVTTATRIEQQNDDDAALSPSSRSHPEEKTPLAVPPDTSPPLADATLDASCCESTRAAQRRKAKKVAAARARANARKAARQARPAKKAFHL